MNKPLRVDVVFDFVCPWCYIGKRRLETALEAWRTQHPSEPAPVVRWLPFQLNPDIPDLEKQAHMVALGRSLGLAFEFDRITAQPNTIDAHRLSGCAQGQGWQDAMVEALFKAYFTQGIDLNDHDALVSLAAGVGFDWGAVAMYLGSTTDVQTVVRLELDARVAGIDIVPFYIFNDRVTVAGAQEVNVLLDAIAEATRNEVAPVTE
jgi:predicted DsbA family dithiol-disulfide isomerase